MKRGEGRGLLVAEGCWWQRVEGGAQRLRIRRPTVKPSAFFLSRRPSPIAHRPSSIARHPSPIAHPPSPIVHRPLISFRVQQAFLPRHIYVHVPFCARRCVYCDFAIAVRRSVPVDDYVTAVGRELALRFPGEEPWPVDTLYFGGGTPSRLGPEGIARL